MQTFAGYGMEDERRRGGVQDGRWAELDPGHLCLGQTVGLSAWVSSGQMGLHWGDWGTEKGFEWAKVWEILSLHSAGCCPWARMSLSDTCGQSLCASIYGALDGSC